jgi:major membrane immunogen (membrane-anchored lipoprotein)
MKKEAAAMALALICALLPLTGCRSGDDNAAYKDGTYTGISGEDDEGAYGEATIRIENGGITACEFVTWQKDGSVKDESYGKINGEISNQDYYDKAQLAVEAMKRYAAALMETRRLKDVDAVSGATIAFNQFSEAVGAALDEAKN